MDYSSLLDLAMKLGYRLAMSGAETFRIEESINRVMTSYSVSAETFAIPNLLIINIETPDGQTLTRMRRIGHHGTNLDAVERYNSISRRICSERPSPDVAIQWIHDSDATGRRYSLAVHLVGSFLGAGGFALLSGGSFADSVASGICGILVGLVSHFTTLAKINSFFSTIASSFILALGAYMLGALHIANNTDAASIGALMILVPGLLFTNAMRDIIFGDTNSGINRIVQVLLIAMAIALGTGAAWTLSNRLFPVTAEVPSLAYPVWLQCIFCFIGCVGFAIIFNIHGPGGLLCALGGALTWGVYILALHFTSNGIFSNLIAAVFAGVYSEVMARVRKYPAISYLVVSLFPLLPGAGIYYTANYIVRGEMSSFVDKGLETIAIAGALAVGILIVSTVVRFWGDLKYKRHNKRTC